MVPDVLPELIRSRLIMVVRAPSAADAIAAVSAARQGGIAVAEITFTTPDAPAAIRAIRTEHPDMIVGAGTVLTRAEAEASIDAGAQFIVSPGLDPDLIASVPPGVAVVPGVLSPSEVMRATSAGARAVKLFPARSVGIGHLRALLAPFPDLLVIPTGGVSPADAADWLQAGAAAVGIGGALSPNVRVTRSVAGSIAAEAARAVDAVATYRNQHIQEMT